MENVLCQICEMNQAEKVILQKDKILSDLENGIVFHVCKDCIKERICPKCKGEGKVYVKHMNAQGGLECCDLCDGDGIFNYTECTINTDSIKIKNGIVFKPSNRKDFFYCVIETELIGTVVLKFECGEFKVLSSYPNDFNEAASSAKSELSTYIAYDDGIINKAQFNEQLKKIKEEKKT